MLLIGSAFFGTYVFLYAIDELKFHHERSLTPSEWRWRLLNTALITGAVAYALFVEYGKKTTTGFGAILGVSMLVFPLVEREPHTHVGGNERFVHSVLSMMHPPMLILLAATWRFIDGAGFFLNMVLPFSTKHLRPLCWGYFGTMSTILFVQLVYWPFKFRRPRRVLPADPLAGDATGLVPVGEEIPLAPPKLPVLKSRRTGDIPKPLPAEATMSPVAETTADFAVAKAAAAGAAPVRETAVRETEVRQTVVRETVVTEMPHKEVVAKEVSVKEVAAKEVAVKEVGATVAVAQSAPAKPPAKPEVIAVKESALAKFVAKELGSGDRLAAVTSASPAPAKISAAASEVPPLAALADDEKKAS